MSFSGFTAKYQRLFKESAAWKLLRADNAPFILAFLEDLFSEENEVPFGRAKVVLEAELQRCRETGIWETETGAGAYLNQWIRAGWLRELDDQLTKTDAGEVALRFCRNLDQRAAGTTASHLRIVQEAVRDFAMATSLNPDERMHILKAKQAEIQSEMDSLRAGVVHRLSEAEQQERLREIYQLAFVLTGDFRRVEDEIRELDKEIRVQMIESGKNRGEVLESVIQKENLLAETEAGSAFESFFHLLSDENRSEEFRDQLRGILSRPAAKRLKPGQRHFLTQLMRELARESDRVFRIRRRTQESLRAYLESGAALENRAVDKLLSQLERLAVQLKEHDVNLRTKTNLRLPVGPVKITSPDSLRLRMPDEKVDTSGIEEKINSKTPTSAMLESLEAVRIRDLALRARDTLRQHGPASIASLVSRNPIQSGLEELVAYLRIAKSINAAALNDKEVLEIQDGKGMAFEATIPKYMLTFELFPEDIEDMAV